MLDQVLGPPGVSEAERLPETAPGHEPDAIFIVGVSRSGTTLMRRVLDSHSRIGIATENHYLGHLLEREGARHYFRSLGDPSDDQVIRGIVDQVYSGELQRRSRLRELSPYWRWLVKNVERDDFERRLLASDRTERGIFSTLMRTYADRRGKAIMGEKTPAHLGYVDTLMTWYPGARVIHMMRDPRAIYVSELRRRAERATTVPYRQLVHVPPVFRAFVLHQVAWAWADAVNRHHSLTRAYPEHYRLVRFEDLVREPGPTLASVTDFLGVAMEERLLQQRVVSRGSQWHQPGFDGDAAERWRDQIDPRARAWLERLLGTRMRAVGYAE